MKKLLIHLFSNLREFVTSADHLIVALKKLRKPLFKPEAWWKLAGGEASLRAGTTGLRPQRRMRPGRGAGNSRSIPAPLPGCVPFYDRFRGFRFASPPANFFSALRAAIYHAFAACRAFPAYLAIFAYLAGLFSAVAEEPFFKKGDVIAIVGGEDMVALSEYGYLELLLTRALPGHRLKFRNLAWEGDTVFEQRRDLNFPPLEAQLDQVGATVVLCQFGQMESLAGKEKLPEFVAAYEKLIARMGGGGKRRIALVAPSYFIYPAYSESRDDTLREYQDAIKQIAQSRSLPFSNPMWEVVTHYTDEPVSTRDGVHPDEETHSALACELSKYLLAQKREAGKTLPSKPRDEYIATKIVAEVNADPEACDAVRQLITAKDRLWFDYWRVQNWAFLAGDRTEQPSSRDHVDRTKRWFPAEREQFLPLIEAKEQEIWSLAAKLALP